MPKAELQAALATLEELLQHALVTARGVERGFDLPDLVLSERISRIREAALELRRSYEDGMAPVRGRQQSLTFIS